MPPLRRLNLTLVLLFVSIVCIVYILFGQQQQRCSFDERSTKKKKVDESPRWGELEKERPAKKADGPLFGDYRDYGNELPLIFIGGVPRSGTTLMRAMLDAHPAVRCGEETRVIPRILGMRAQWKRNKKEAKRLEEAGVSDAVINAAVSAFVIEVIARHGEAAERLCNKDPFTLKSTEYLTELFPKAKFLLMLRDGRATVHSIISRKVTITGFDLTNPRQCLEKWNAAISTMWNQCDGVGEDRCLVVRYEQLVLHPERVMHRVLRFLDLPWNNSVLHHDRFIGKKISLSLTERSTDQVVKPIYLNALTKWVGKFPADVVADMANVAPMLHQLGYDPMANPPNYGQASDLVRRNMEDLEKNRDLWDERVSAIEAKRNAVIKGLRPGSKSEISRVPPS